MLKFNVMSGFVVYTLLWWVLFYISLPIGVKREENLETGMDQGAPQEPNMLKKIIVVTIITTIIFISYVVISYL
jgi:predicted secreted protein